MTLQPNPGSSGHVLASMGTTPDVNTMRAATRRLRVPRDVADAAIANIVAGTATGAVFTGKMASGKDTIAEAVANHFFTEGCPSVVHRTSDPIREELNEIIRLVADSETALEAAITVAEKMELTSDVAEHVTVQLYEPTRDGLPSAEDRTNTNRHLLQYLADRGRRDIDPQYWVRRCFTKVVEDIASGTTAMLSGGRYPNEVYPAQTLGLFVVRIWVSPETQAARVRARDGIEPDPELFLNENECALDDYVGFNLVVSNDGELAPTIETTVRHLQAHVRAITSL